MKLRIAAQSVAQSVAHWAERSEAQLSGVERGKRSGVERAGRENKNPQKFLGLLGVLVFCFVLVEANY